MNLEKAVGVQNFQPSTILIHLNLILPFFVYEIVVVNTHSDT